MSRSGLPHDVIEHPCSDGQPMAETDLHAACMVYVTCALRRHFANRGQEDVYVGSSNFLYYEQGNPRAVVALDVYVVVGAPAHLRDTYLLWNEPKGPDFVLEVTSPSRATLRRHPPGLNGADSLRRNPARTGEDLLTYEEVDKAREAEVAARQQEAAVRRTAEARIAELEARRRDLENASAKPEEP